MPAPRTRVVLISVLVLLGISVNVWISLQNRESWNVDFNQFRAAAALAGTGHLYDWDALRALQSECHTKAVPTGRLPMFAAVLKPLAWMPWGIARAAWFLICGSAAALIILLWPGARRRALAVAMSWSAPLAMSLAFGQDSPLYLFVFCAGAALLARRRDFTSGLAFALCAAKFHLAVGIPILVLAGRRWRAVAGGALGLASVLAGSFAIEGPEWPAKWLAISHLPAFDPAPERMPNFRGLASWTPFPVAAEALLTLALLALLFAVCRRAEFSKAAPLALAAGLLTGHHGYTYDCVLLVPLIASVLVAGHPLWLRVSAAVLTTPVPYILLTSDTPWAGQIMIVGFVALCGIALLRRGVAPENASGVTVIGSTLGSSARAVPLAKT